MRATLLSVLLLIVGSVLPERSDAQQPSPSNQLVVQAATVAPAAAAAAKGAATTDQSAVQIAIKAFEEARKGNEELLKKQEATLQQLDELEKAAEQLRIFSKR